MSDETKIPAELAAPHTVTVATEGPKESMAARSGAHALAPPRPAIPTPSSGFLGADCPPPGFHEFAEKWLAEHIPMVEAKAREYGSNSLQRKGERYMRAQGRSAEHPVQALELACFQYIAEKLDRVEDAALRGLPASTDTWTDMAVYALMGLYIRSTGSWL